MVTAILTILGLVVSVIVGAAIKSLLGSLVFYGTIGLVIFFGVKQIDKLKQPMIDLLVVLLGGFAVANTMALKAKQPARPIMERSHHTFHSAKELEAFVENGGVSPAGVEVTCDLPESLRLHNTGGMGRRGPGTGSGLCVFTSITHGARFQNEVALWNLQKQMTMEPGVNGYPQMVDAMLAKYAPGVKYIQYQGNDPAFLEDVLRTGRMLAVAYNGQDTRYGNKVIGHMVNLVYLDDKEACILDNNFEKKYYWMTRKEFLDRWHVSNGDGWAIALIAPPPPGPPRNVSSGDTFDLDLNKPLLDLQPMLEALIQ